MAPLAMFTLENKALMNTVAIPLVSTNQNYILNISYNKYLN